MNFSGVDLKDYKVRIKKGKYRVMLNTDDKKFGGKGTVKKKVFTTSKQTRKDTEYTISVDIPRLTCMYIIKEI